MKLGEWQHITLELPQGSGSGRIRIDPSDRPCLIEFAGLHLKRAADAFVIKSWTDASEMRAFLPISDLVSLPVNNRISFLSTGDDPSLLLPELDPVLADQPLVFEARVRIDENIASAVAVLQSAPTPTDVALDAAIAERDQALIRNQQLGAEIRNLQAERVALVADYRRVHALNESLLNEAASLNNRLVSEQERCSGFEEETTALKTELRWCTSLAPGG